MNKVLIFLISIISFNVNAQNNLNIQYYPTTSDYLNKNLSKAEVSPQNIRVITKEIRKIRKLIDPITGKRSKKTRIPWAIHARSTTYFNFAYSNDMYAPDLYIKPDILGRFCIIYVNKKKLRLIHSNSPNYYGGGLTEAIVNESRKWGGNWINKNDEKIKIFILDTQKLEKTKPRGNRNSIWKNLNRKNFNEILELSWDKEKIESLTLEEVKQIILKKNN